jgi:hypothetical protein
MNEEQVRQLIREELANFILNDRFTFQKNIQIFDARNIQLGKGTGTKFGTEATQKLGFFGTDPVVQQSAIAAASGGTPADVEVRAVVVLILTALRNLGLIAT